MVSSKPSLVRWCGVLGVQGGPALSTNTSTSLTVLAKLRTDDKSAIADGGRASGSCCGGVGLGLVPAGAGASWPAFANILLLEPDAGIGRHDDAFRGYFGCGLEQLGLRLRRYLPDAASACSGRRPAAPSVSRRSRRPGSALAGASTGRAGVRWPLGASACAQQCKELQVQNASSMYRWQPPGVVGIRSQKWVVDYWAAKKQFDSMLCELRHIKH